MAADAAIATMRRVCIKPKLTPAAKKAASSNKITITAGIIGEGEVIGSHLSAKTRFHLKYIAAGCSRTPPALWHSAAFERVGG